MKKYDTYMTIKRKRIGLVLSTVPGYSETFFKNKIAGLQAAGHEVVLLVTEKTDVQQDLLGCQVVSAARFKGGSFRVFMNSAITFLRVLMMAPKRSFKHYSLDRKAGIPMLHRVKRLVQNAFILQQELDWLHFGFGMLAVGREHVAQAIGASMAVSFRGFDLYLSPLKHPGCYALLFKIPVRYHVLSKEMKQDLMQYGIANTAIDVITPAIDVGFFKSSTEGRPFSSTDTLKLVTVARLHWKKGLEYTLEAMALLREQGVPFQYTIIGDGDAYERLVFATHQLGLQDLVHFAGRMTADAVKTTLETSDVYIQYSIQEGFCNAVLEAQAMGLLCVVSNAEGLAENVLHEQTGWVVKKRQPKLLATQLATIYNMATQQRQAISAQAVSRVRKTFTLEQQQRQFLEFYKK